MSGWRTLRNAASPIHVEYNHTFTNNLSATGFQYRIGDTLELGLDLSGNLRKRAKTSNSCVDAQDLASGGMQELSLVQIDEQSVVQGLHDVVMGLDPKPEKWKLRVILDKEYQMSVAPEFRRPDSLLLRIEGTPTNPST